MSNGNLVENPALVCREERNPPLMNNVCLIGNLTHDPELKYTATGKAVCTFSIAVNSSFKDSDGNKEVDFFPIVAWQQSAEFAANYLNKGSMVSVTGRLKTRTWVKDDGAKVKITEIVANDLRSLNRRGDSAPESSGDQAVAGAPPQKALAAQAGVITHGPGSDSFPADPMADEDQFQDPFAEF